MGTDKRIDVLATAITGGITADELADLELAYAPPYGSAKDPVNQLGYVADNVMTGTTHTIGWDEIDGTRPVRHRRAHRRRVPARPHRRLGQHLASTSCARGTPRSRGAPTGSRCRWRSTARSASAGTQPARLLTQLGYDVVNLDGGWLTYSLARAS